MGAAKLTKAQLECLRILADGRTHRGAAVNLPDIGWVGWKTARSLKAKGLADNGPLPLLGTFHITDAGRAALKDSIARGGGR
jgi:hypothetical protein